MKYILFSLLSIIMAGCTTSRQLREKAIREVYGCTVSDKGLYDATCSYYHPTFKTCYEHGNNGLMKVIQSLEGGVLVVPQYNVWDSERDNARKMHIFVETTDEYVDQESLRSGYYEFTGVYEYTTVKQKQLRVRKFRKLALSTKE